MTMASCSRSSSMLLFLLLGLASATSPSASPPAPSPWMDTSMCPATDSLMVCQLKKGMCSPINTVFSPPGGPVKAVANCANSTGAVLGPQFFLSIGLSFLSGAPESLADKASSDPTTATAIRRCALNATGLLNSDMLTLNRTAVANSLTNALIGDELGSAVAEAVNTCPEPVDYKLTDFLKCLKEVCMNNVATSPFISMATATLKGANTPAAAAAASLAAKKPAPPKSAAPAASSPGASAYSAAGPAAYMGGAGAYPFAGAAGGAAGAGAYPFAGGAAAGAGSYPFAGAAGGAAAGAGSYPFAGGAAGGAGGAPMMA